MEEGRPGREHHIARQGQDMGEEARSLRRGLARRLPGRLDDIECAVPGEGEEVERGERHRQEFFTVAEIVFEFIAVIFHHVEGLVLDLPARPAGGGDIGDVGFADRQAGHPGDGILDAAATVENLERDPVDQRGVLAIAQGNPGDPPIAAGLDRLALADRFGVPLGLGAVDEIVECLVRGLLAGEDEIIAGVRQQGDNRLAGEQIIAEIDRTQRAEPVGVLGVPALGGIAFAVLFFGAVLRRDELGKQRDDLGMTGRDRRRRQQGVVALYRAIAAFSGQAMRTTELLRAEILGAVPGDQDTVTIASASLRFSPEFASAMAIDANRSRRPGCASRIAENASSLSFAAAICQASLDSRNDSIAASL